MTLSRRILNRPMTMIIIFVILSIAGATLTTRLATNLLPELNMPALAVVTTYPMASPTEVEDLVTRKIESQLVNISGLDSMTSYSYDSYSMIVMMMEFDVNMTDTTADIRDNLARVSGDLPDECDAPFIFRFDPNSEPVITFSLTGDQPLQNLLKAAEEDIQPRLERINGVAEVSLSGGLEEIVQVSFYQERLDSLGLTISQISSAIASQNMKLTAGQMTDGGKNYIIQTSGEIDSLTALEQTTISVKPLGQTSYHEILLRDVADVKMGARDQESIVLINGREGIQFSVRKTNDANMIEVVERAKEEMDDIQRTLPRGNTITVLQDNSILVNSVIRQVFISALTGILFAVLVLFIFLRRFKPTLIVAISIPVSILITIGSMSLAGKTFNMITLTGLILALGMIVDGSIVVIENIFRYRQKGALQRPSAELGTQEVMGAITGSILTSICVFLPLLLFRSDLGVLGLMFQDMAFTIVVALVASLAVSILLVPVLASRIFTIDTREERPVRNRMLRGLDDGMERGMDGFTNGYRRIIGWCLKRKFVVIIISLLLLALSIVQLPRLGLIMMPPSGETSIILDVTLPEGTALEHTEEVMQQWQRIALDEVPETERRSIVISSGAAGGLGSTGGSHTGRMEITLAAPEERSMSDEEVREIFRSRFDMFPDARIGFSTTDQARMMTGSDISIKFKGNDLDELVRISEELIVLVEENVPQVREFTSSHSNSLPELELQLDREKLFDLGLNAQTVAYELRSQIAGVISTTINLQGDSYDVVLQLREEDRDSEFDINKLFITNNFGQKIPFSSFGKVNKTVGPVSIFREDRSRTITLSGTINAGEKANFIQNEIETLARERIVLSEGITMEAGGQMEILDDSIDGIKLVLIFAILLVFGVMVAQFESFKSPFIIIIMIPMLLIGVSGMYTILGEPLSMVSMIGIVMLLGIVVNNGIILVDSINLHRKRGLTVFDACRDAAANRLRPVLMTTLTTIFAMIPMAFASGNGTDIVKPIGITVIGGLTSNTIMTLFLVPVLYMIFHRKERKKEKASPKEMERV